MPLPDSAIDAHTAFASLSALTAFERAVIVDRGVPARLVQRLAAALGVTMEALCTLIGVRHATVSRTLKTDSRLSRADSEGAFGMARLIGQVEQIVQASGDGTPFDAGRWVAAFLDAPSPALGGRRPSELMRTSDGRSVVSTLVAQMQSGAYA